MSQFIYKFGEKSYVQRKLVLGQVRQLTEIFQTVEIPSTINAVSIIKALGSQIHKAIAIVLTPEGESLKNKNIDELANELEFSIDMEEVMKVVEDFFDCNEFLPLLKKFNETVETISKKLIVEETG